MCNISFRKPRRKSALRETIDFYRHAHGWPTGLIAGDSMLVGEVIQHKDDYRLCYIRGPEGLLIGLAQELS
jgi:hypothetical protein